MASTTALQVVLWAAQWALSRAYVVPRTLMDRRLLSDIYPRGLRAIQKKQVIIALVDSTDSTERDEVSVSNGRAL